MKIPSYGPTAFLVTLYSLYELVPQVVVQDVEVNGDCFSCSLEFPKKIGPEFREFLLESVRLVCRKDLPIRSFSMMRSVFQGYIQKEDIMCDSRLEDALEDEESSPQELLDIIQIGDAFCSLQEPFAEYLESTGMVKWIDVCDIDFIKHNDKEKNPRHICFLRGSAAEGAKKASKNKKSLENFFQYFRTAASKRDYIHVLRRSEADELGHIGEFSFITAKGFQDLQDIASLFQSKMCMLPHLLEDRALDIHHPISALYSIKRTWKEVVHQLSGAQEEASISWRGAFHKAVLAQNYAVISPLPNLQEISFLSLYRPKTSLSELEKILQKIRAFCSNTAIPSTLSVKVCVSSKRKEKKHTSVFSLVKEVMQGFENQEYTVDPDLYRADVSITISSFFLDTLERPFPRSIILFSLYDDVDESHFQDMLTTNTYIHDCCVFPLLSYEIESIASKSLPLSSQF